MSVDWASAAKAFFEALPHPHDPTGHLKIGEYATAVRLATVARFGGHASPQEASLFWREFAPNGVPIMAPEEFEHTLERIAPLSYTYHGRPPTMKEIMTLADKAPHEARRYFADLPHKYLPHMTAAEVVKTIEAAKPHSNEHLGRDPVFPEVSHLHHAGVNNAADYYQGLAEQSQRLSDTLPQDNNVVSAPFGRNASARGVQTFGR